MIFVIFEQEILFLAYFLHLVAQDPILQGCCCSAFSIPVSLSSAKHVQFCGLSLSLSSSRRLEFTPAPLSAGKREKLTSYLYFFTLCLSASLPKRARARERENRVKFQVVSVGDEWLTALRHRRSNERVGGYTKSTDLERRGARRKKSGRHCAQEERSSDGFNLQLHWHSAHEGDARRSICFFERRTRRRKNAVPRTHKNSSTTSAILISRLNRRPHAYARQRALGFHLDILNERRGSIFASCQTEKREEHGE